MYDAIIIADTAEPPMWVRGYGAHRIANHLRLNGYSTLVIDFASAMSFDQWCKICQLALNNDTKLIGISSTWLPYRDENNNPVTEMLDIDFLEEEYRSNFVKDFATGNSKKWLDVAKKYAPNAKTIMGGPKIPWYLDVEVDHYIVGLGESQIIEFLNQPNRIWPTVIQHDTTASANTWSWNKSQTLYTKADQIKQGEFLTLETSRGCRFACKFCSYPLIGQKNMMSYMKEKDVLYREMMDNYEKWGITDYRIADDTFNDSTEKLEYVLDVTRKLPFKITTRAYVRLDVIAVDLQQIEMLKELGIAYSWIGIDSLHPKTSKIIGKGMPSNRKKETLIEMKKSWGKKTEIITSYIIGLPQETVKSVEQSFSWLASLQSPVDRVQFIPLRIDPTPSEIKKDLSEFDKTYQKYGYSFPTDNMRWVKNDGSDIYSFNQANKLAKSLNKLFESKPIRHLEIKPRIQIENPNSEYFDKLIEYLNVHD